MTASKTRARRTVKNARDLPSWWLEFKPLDEFMEASAAEHKALQHRAFIVANSPSISWGDIWAGFDEAVKEYSVAVADAVLEIEHDYFAGLSPEGKAHALAEIGVRCASVTALPVAGKTSK